MAFQGDTIRTEGRASILDVLCEGEIEGLVDLYLDDVRYSTGVSGSHPGAFFNPETGFRTGKPNGQQALLPEEFSRAQVPLTTPESVEITPQRPISYQFNTETYPDAKELLVNVRIPALASQLSAKAALLYSRKGCFYRSGLSDYTFVIADEENWCKKIKKPGTNDWERKWWYEYLAETRYIVGDDAFEDINHLMQRMGCGDPERFKTSHCAKAYAGAPNMDYDVTVNCDKKVIFYVSDSGVLAEANICGNILNHAEEMFANPTPTQLANERGRFWKPEARLYDESLPDPFTRLPAVVGRQCYVTYRAPDSLKLAPVSPCWTTWHDNTLTGDQPENRNRWCSIDFCKTPISASSYTVIVERPNNFINDVKGHYPSAEGNCAWFVEEVDAGVVTQTGVSYDITLFRNGVKFMPSITETHFHKSEGGFVWQTVVPMPTDPNLRKGEFAIQVSRNGDGSNMAGIRDKIYIDSVVVKSDNIYSYPNTAVAGVAFNSNEFPSLSTRAYDLKLLKVKVPKGYVPTQYNREGDVIAPAIYPNVWNGEFEEQKIWTDNPAWCFYDIITNRRYGLGEFVDGSIVDKWTLYQISKYCDELVDNGSGQVGLIGKEPRFTCNMLFTTTDDAMEVVNNMASVFRGMIYWAAGRIFTIQDKDKLVIQQFNNSSVLGGKFQYSSSSGFKRRTVAQVRYVNKKTFYRPDVEVVEDIDGINRYGVKEIQVAAFACSSRMQARRVGRWSLLTEKLETEIISFKVAMDGLYVMPGDIISIYDDFRILQKHGGRILEMSDDRKSVLLDRTVEMNPALTYNLNLSIPKANRDASYQGSNPDLIVSNSTHIDDMRKSFIETSEVDGYADEGGYTRILLKTPYSERYEGGTWVLESFSTGSTSMKTGGKEYRVLNIQEEEKSAGFAISAVEFNRGKFEEIDSDGGAVANVPILNLTAINLGGAATNVSGPNGSWVWVTTGEWRVDVSGGQAPFTYLWTTEDTSGNTTILKSTAAETGLYAYRRVSTKKTSTVATCTVRDSIGQEKSVNVSFMFIGRVVM